MTRRIVHYTDDARSPVNGTEGVSDVWQGFRYDYVMLLSEMERADLSREAKKTLCEDLAGLLDGMKDGVNRLYLFSDFMADWKEGFAEIPVKETPAKKKRGKDEPRGGTAGEIFPDAHPGEDAGIVAPAGGDTKLPSGEDTAGNAVFREDADTAAPDGEETEEDAKDETIPGEDALKGDASEADEVAVTETDAGVDVIIDNIPYSSEDELAAARFREVHGSPDNEDGDEDGDGDVPPAGNVSCSRGGDEKDGGAEEDDRVPEKSEDL